MAGLRLSGAGGLLAGRLIKIMACPFEEATASLHLLVMSSDHDIPCTDTANAAPVIIASEYTGAYE